MSLNLDINKCETELEEFKIFLDSKVELSENSDILPFFRDHQHLSCLIALTLSQDAVSFNLSYAFEYALSGDFRLDLIVGDENKKAYCFIEFEDARANSLFNNSGRAIPEWGTRFLKGFSQLIDWLWKREEVETTPDFRRQFGEPPHHIKGVLIIGRSEQLESEERTRLEWFSDKVIIDTQKITCLTFDDLYDSLRERLDHYIIGAKQLLGE